MLDFSNPTILRIILNLEILYHLERSIQGIEKESENRININNQ